MRKITLKTLALVLLGMASAVGMPTNAFADNSSVWTGTDPSDISSSETYFLYNVATCQWLGRGGVWGTQAVLANEGIPMTVSSDNNHLTFIPTEMIDSVGGTYLSFSNGLNTQFAPGTFFTNLAADSYGCFSLTPAKNSDGTYTLSVSVSSTDYSGVYYLCGDVKSGVISGSQTPTNGCDWKIVSLTERRQAFANRDKVYSVNGLPATFLLKDHDFTGGLNEVSNWKFMSPFDSSTIYDATNGITNWQPYKACTYYTYTYTGKGSHPAIYYDEDNYYTPKYKEHVFDADDLVVGPTLATLSEIEKTKRMIVDCGGDGFALENGYCFDHGSEEVEVTYNLDESKTVTTYTTTPCYVGNGYGNEFPKVDTAYVDHETDTVPTTKTLNPQEMYADQYTANIHGANGIILQTIADTAMVRSGWYKVCCKAFTTDSVGEVVLFAYTDDNTDNITWSEVKRAADISPRDTTMTYVKAHTILQGEDYKNSLMIYVDNKTAGDETSGVKSLTIGVIAKNADNNAWTCFDDFELYYLDDIPTGINGIVKNTNIIGGNIYNLNGQLVRRNTTSLDGLAPGVYVMNGKKYVVK